MNAHNVKLAPVFCAVTERAIRTAEQYAGGDPSLAPPGTNGSALLCIEDAKALVAEGENLYAGWRALDSLAHSVGVFHRAYVATAESLKAYK